MLNIKKSLPFLLLLALLAGCRYEDGPLVSFRSPWTRLTMHPKKLTRLEMDGVDYLPMFNADFPNSTFRFTEEGHWSQYIIYWSSDRFPEPVWAGYVIKSSNHYNSVELNFFGSDRSKPDVQDFVDFAVMNQYKHLLVSDTGMVYGTYIFPLYSILKLTVNKLVLENWETAGYDAYNPVQPKRHITFESL